MKKESSKENLSEIANANALEEIAALLDMPDGQSPRDIVNTIRDMRAHMIEQSFKINFFEGLMLNQNILNSSAQKAFNRFL